MPQPQAKTTQGVQLHRGVPARTAILRHSRKEKTTVGVQLLSRARSHSAHSRKEKVPEREAILGHAFDGGGLSRLFAAAGLPWDAPLADRMAAAAVKQIGGSLRARGETSYSLRHNGEPNKTRLASLDRYFGKLIAKRMAATS